METFNVPRDLIDNIQDVLGKTRITMATMVQFELKPDKLENRVLVLTEFRLYMMTARVPCKVEQSLSFLNIHSIESKCSTKLTISVEGRKLHFIIADEAKIDKFAVHIIESLAIAFPKVPIEHMIGQIDIQPPTRSFQRELQEMRLRQDKRDPGPCGGFSLSYRYMCDHHGLQYMADVAWDIDTIYMSHDQRELRLGDFDHLDGRYLIPIVAALEYNHWFTSLNADNIKLLPEVINCIPIVMKKNSVIEELHLSNVGIRSDFIQRLSAAVLANAASTLVYLDLSNNLIDDKGFFALASTLAKAPKGLVHLNISNTSITARGVNRLADSFAVNPLITSTLQHIDLSRNSLRGEDITNLYNFLAQPNMVTSFNISGTECALDPLFGALLRGCTQKMQYLDLSNNGFLSKKVTAVPQTCKQFFGSAMALKGINLCNCRIPAEGIKYILLGIGSNPVATDVEVNLSMNNLVVECMTLEMCLPDISNITALDLSENNFDVALLGLIPKLAKNRSLKKLLLGRNFNNVKSRNLSQVMEFLTEMIHEDESNLESLSLAGSKLRSHINILINALGGNNSLKEIDISGNFMGDVGARMLAKALQINTSLHTIHWDNNMTSPQGFMDVAYALEKNFTLRNMPIPLNDVLLSLKTNQAMTETALQSIGVVLQRNHSPRKFVTAQGYRLQQGFLICPIQQMLDRSIVTVQNSTLKLENKNIHSEDVLEDLTEANCLIKDASNARQLLAKFQAIAGKSETEGSTLYSELQAVSTKLHATMEGEIKRNLDDMLECSTDQCPTLLENQELYKTVVDSSTSKAQMPKHFMTNLVMEQLGADVFNKLGEVNLTVASHMSDQLLEGVLSSLNAIHDKLICHLRDQRETEKASGTRKESVDDGLLRKKSTDDELELLGPDAFSTAKRKSIYSRKLRPHSSDGSTQVEPLLSTGSPPPLSPTAVRTTKMSGKDAKQEKKSVSPVPKPRSKRKSVAPQSPAIFDDEEPAEKSQDTHTSSTELTDGSLGTSPFNSRESTPSHESPAPSKSKKSKPSGLDLGVPLESSAPKLEHLVKDRPKRPKNRPATRATVSRTDEDDDDDDADNHVDSFFSSPSQASTPTDTKKFQSQNSVDSDKSSGKKKDLKKGWSPFSSSTKEKGGGLFHSKKTQSVKSPDPSSKKSSFKTTEVREVIGGHEVKDRSHSPADLDHEETKLENKETDNVEVKPRRPVGATMGLPVIGGGALMAEMKKKRESMTPLASKQKADSVTSVRTPETITESQTSIKAPPGGRPRMPPGGMGALKTTSTPRSVSPGEDNNKPPTRPRPPIVPPKPKPSDKPGDRDSTGSIDAKSNNTKPGADSLPRQKPRHTDAGGESNGARSANSSMELIGGENNKDSQTNGKQGKADGKEDFIMYL